MRHLQFLVENDQLCDCDMASLIVPQYLSFMDYIEQRYSFIFVVDNFFVPTHPKQLRAVCVKNSKISLFSTEKGNNCEKFLWRMITS